MTTWSLYHCEASTKPSFLLQQQQPSSSVYLSHHCTQHSSTTTNSEAVSLSSHSFTGSWQLDHTVITLSDPSQCHQHCWHETWSWYGWDPRVGCEIIWFFTKNECWFHALWCWLGSLHNHLSCKPQQQLLSFNWLQLDYDSVVRSCLNKSWHLTPSSTLIKLTQTSAGRCQAANH